MKYEKPILQFLSVLVQSPAFFHAQPMDRMDDVEGPMDRIFNGLGQVKVCTIGLAMCFACYMAHMSRLSESFS